MGNFKLLKTSLVTVIAAASIISFSSCGLANTPSSSGGGAPTTTASETTALEDGLPKGIKEVSGTVSEITDTSITITSPGGAGHSFDTSTATKDSDIATGDTVKITYSEDNEMVAQSIELTKKAE